MKKIVFISLAALLAVSCDLLFNRDSGSTSPVDDVAISSLDISESATRGEVLEVGVQVKNLGIQDISDEITITLTDQTQDSLLGTKSIEGGLASEDSLNVSYELNTGEFTVGEHLIVASHNIGDDKAANDSLTSTLIVNQPEITDIAISSVNAPAAAARGETVDVEVNLENSGNQDVNGAISVELIDETDGSTIDAKTISGGLAAGNKAVLTFAWNTSEASAGDHTLVASHNVDDENAGNDSRTAEVSINEPKVTDIAVTEVSGPSSANQGEEAEISVTLENQGNQDVGETFSLTLTDQTDGTEVATRSVSGLAEGESTTLTFDWNTAEASLGEHTLVASHDLDDDKGDNNSGSTQVTIEEPPFFDIAITGVEADEEAARIGEEIDIEVTVQNLGNIDVNEDIMVTLIDDRDGTTIGTRELDGGLEEGESETLTFEWDTAGESFGNHTLIASHNFEDDKTDNDSASDEVTITLF